MPTYLRGSPKRMTALKEAGSSSRMPKFCTTRWTANDKCVSSLLKNWTEIADALEAIADDPSTDVKAASSARGYSRAMTDFRLFFALRLSSVLYGLITPVITAVQRPTLAVSEALSMV